MTGWPTSSISSSPGRRSSVSAQSTKAGLATPKSINASDSAPSRSAGDRLESSAAVERGRQLVQVPDEGLGEQLLLAGEVPVDDGAVDARRRGRCPRSGRRVTRWRRTGPGSRSGSPVVAPSVGPLPWSRRRSSSATVERQLSEVPRTLGSMRSVSELRRQVAPIEVVSDYQPAGDQPAAIAELQKRIDAGVQDVVAHGRHRHRQDRHHRVAGRAAAASDAGHDAQQAAGGPVRQRAARAAAAQRRRVLRVVLRLLPTRGVHRAERHLHREGLLDQRGGRAAAALGHVVAAHPPRRHRGRHRVVHLRPRLGAGVPRAHDRLQGRRGGRARAAAAHARARRSTCATTSAPPAARSGSRATPSRSSRCTRRWRCGWSSSATRSSGS